MGEVYGEGEAYIDWQQKQLNFADGDKVMLRVPSRQNSQTSPTVRSARPQQFRRASVNR